NNLVGTLPAKLNDLDIFILVLTGNRLSGPVPAAILTKWLEGKIRFTGYSSQFDSQIEQIVIRGRSVSLCGDYEAILKPADATLRTEKCRKSKPRPVVYCEVKTGRTDAFAQDLDKLARLMVTSGFFELDSEYLAPM